MQELDERTEARDSATYTVGKGKAVAVRRPCMRSCTADQGLQVTCYHQQEEPPSLTVEPWPTNQPHILALGASTPGEGKPVHPQGHNIMTIEENQEAQVK
jgi:hypothetical protein